MKAKLVYLSMLLGFWPAGASNLANPGNSVPPARIAVGASYHLGGNTITNREVLSMMNRVHGRISYSPFQYVNFGFDMGATQIEVDRYGSGDDSIPVFHGEFGFSGGGHLKISTPFMFRNTLAFVAIGQGTLFKSENKHGAYYAGKDGIGAVGIQAHIPHFGYISAGPMVYLIKGENQGYKDEQGTVHGKGIYSNVNNIRGWLAIDYYPKLNAVSQNRPYFTIEGSVSPKAHYERRLPVQEFSVSISFGTITQRLYGVESDVEWEP